MTHMEKEIHEQPQVLKNTFNTNKPIFEKIQEELSVKKIKSVIFAARGSSDNSGVYLKYMFEVYCKLPLSFAAPSVFTVYNSDIDFTDALVIGVSQSGKAEDVLSVINAANKQKAYTLTITNYEDSPLAKAGKHHLCLGVGEEKSVAATKTFTSQMYLLGILVAYISNNQDLIDEFQNIPNGIEKALINTNQIAKIAKKMKNVEDCFVLGRGFQYAITKEIALKLQETTYIKALPFATSDFYHGPLAMADDKSNVLVLAPVDETWVNSIEIIERLSQQNCNLYIITDKEDGLDNHENQIVIPKFSLHSFPFTCIVTAQLLALNISLNKGLNPDIPRSLNKVTVTL